MTISNTNPAHIWIDGKVPEGCPPRPSTEQWNSPRGLEQRIRRGRWIIEHAYGQNTSQVDRVYCIFEAVKAEREIVARTGECSRGCCGDNLVKTPSGNLVCMWTRLPCKRMEDINQQD